MYVDNILNKSLQLLNLKLYKSKPSGNCFFSSIAKYFKLSDDYKGNAANIRKNIINYIKNKVAKPKKDKNPNTSVIVVSITPDAKAGSIFNLSNVNGIIVPAKPATIKLSTIAKPIIIPNIKS